MRTRRASAALAAALSVGCATALVACGAGNPAGARSALDAQLSQQRARVSAIETELSAAVTSAGPRPDALQADQFATLAARARREAATIEGLSHPATDNTRLRDIGAALVAVANDLDQLSTAATEHQSATARSAIQALRVDGSTVRQTYAEVTQALGLRSG